MQLHILLACFLALPAGGARVLLGRYELLPQPPRSGPLWALLRRFRTLAGQDVHEGAHIRPPARPGSVQHLPATGTAPVARLEPGVVAGREEVHPVGIFPLAGYKSPEHIAQGAYGDAWKAVDWKTGEVVAIKFPVLRGFYVTRADAGAKVQEECETMQLIAGSISEFPEGAMHLCRCLEYHVTDVGPHEVPFLVMEHCGTSLEEKQAPQGSSPGPEYLEDVRRWIRGVLKALMFMRGQVPPMNHNDLHMGNVVVDDDGEARLVDFGKSGPEATAVAGQGDLEDVGRIYRRLLCGEQLSRLQLARLPDPSTCQDGSLGFGAEPDFQVIVTAIREGQDASPEQLLEMMPGTG